MISMPEAQMLQPEDFAWTPFPDETGTEFNMDGSLLVGSKREQAKEEAQDV